MTMRPKDMSGLVRGELTVIEPVERRVVSDGRTRTFWRCRCSCGGERVVGSNRIAAARGPKHCGGDAHKRKHQTPKARPSRHTSHIVAWRMQGRRKSLIGMRFGELTVLSVAGYHKHGRAERRMDVIWLCRCSCGKQKTAHGVALKRGRTRSCGGHGGKFIFKDYLAYSSWSNIKERCYNKNHMAYAAYGGRGIHMCERWRASFPAFLADMGERPGREYSIDRIDPDGHYELGNCRWSIDREQRFNKRNTRYVTYGGRLRLLMEVCRERDMPYSVVAGRYYALGWDLDRALGTPVRGAQYGASPPGGSVYGAGATNLRA